MPTSLTGIYIQPCADDMERGVVSATPQLHMYWGVYGVTREGESRWLTGGDFSTQQEAYNHAISVRPGAMPVGMRSNSLPECGIHSDSRYTVYYIRPVLIAEQNSISTSTHHEATHWEVRGIRDVPPDARQRFSFDEYVDKDVCLATFDSVFQAEQLLGALLNVRPEQYDNLYSEYTD